VPPVRIVARATVRTVDDFHRAERFMSDRTRHRVPRSAFVRNHFLAQCPDKNPQAVTASISLECPAPVSISIPFFHGLGCGAGAGRAKGGAPRGETFPQAVARVRGAPSAQNCPLVAFEVCIGLAKLSGPLLRHRFCGRPQLTKSCNAHDPWVANVPSTRITID
jgi:hypothetical protein